MRDSARALHCTLHRSEALGPLAVVRHCERSLALFERHVDDPDLAGPAWVSRFRQALAATIVVGSEPRCSRTPSVPTNSARRRCRKGYGRCAAAGRRRRNRYLFGTMADDVGWFSRTGTGLQSTSRDRIVAIPFHLCIATLMWRR